MEKFISYEKMSKKKQKEYNKQKRNTWGNINPQCKVFVDKKKKYKKNICRKNGNSCHSFFFIIKTLYY